MNGAFNLFGYALPIAPIGAPKQNKFLNNTMYWDTFNRITNIALARFKWLNLPKSCRPEILEETLFFYGCALFMFDEDFGFIHTPVELVGPWNIYNESIERQAHAFEYHKRYDITNSVVIKSNPSMFPDYLTVWNYTPKIANCLRAIDVHTETLKRPFMVRCEEKEVPSVKKAINGIMDNEVAVVGQKIGANVPIEVLDLCKTSHLTDMWANMKNYLNQVFSSLGVKNSYTEKRERMITSEAEGEGNAIRHTLESSLSMRKRACEQINDMFGLDVDVEANELEVFTDELIEMQAARVSGILPGETGESDTETGGDE